jgi:uncharacterized RDD family membrane protein YckC
VRRFGTALLIGVIALSACSDDPPDFEVADPIGNAEPGDVIALRANGGAVEYVSRRTGEIRSFDTATDATQILATIGVSTDGEQRGLLGHTVIDDRRFAAWTDPDTFDLVVGEVTSGSVDRMLGRPARQLPPHPGGSEEPAGSADLSPTDRAVQMQGRFAGSVSRFLPFLADQFVIGVFFAIGALLVQSAIRVVFQTSFDIEDSGAVMVIAFVLWAFLYTAGSLAATGRTIGKAILGLMAVRSDGSKLDARHAALRTLMFPLSFVLFGIGFLIGLVRRDRRELHDLIADTAIVYAWDADTARLRLEASTQGAHAGAATLRR